MAERNGNEKDAKRVGKWLGVVIGLLIVGAVIFNVYWYKQPPATAPDAPSVGEPAPAPEKPPGS